MGTINKAAAAALATLLLSGCIREAEIAMPGDLRSNLEPIEVTGIGGGERGGFRLGSAQGSFTRRSIQTREDDFHVRNFGGGSFAVEGPELPGRLSANCGFDAEEFDSGIVTVSGERLAYHCEFQRDLEPVGGLALAEVPRGRGILAGITRAGEARFGDVRLEIRPVHDMEGGRMPTGTPLGYAFHIGGRQVGAVDLNGLDKTIYAPRSGPEREAVLAASLALSIFWDPGE
jgi:hypothetical protein